MALRDPSRGAYLRLTFSQPTGVVYRATDWTEGDGGFVALPGLEVRLPPNTGSLDERPLAIEFALGASEFLDSLVSGAPVAPTTLQASEVHASVGPVDTTSCAPGAVQSITYGSTWRLVRGIRHPEGRGGVGRAEFVSLKGRLNVPLGIPATPRCAWAFGDQSCQLDVDALEETATIAAIARKRVTLTDPGDAAVVTGRDPEGYWRRGSVRLAGLTLPIRDWAPGSYDLELAVEPPASWVGQVVTLRPGCVGSLAACREWDNEEHFGGFGKAIPAYNPGLETPE
ncbi:MAG: hypothetical protein KIT58_00185 [Planctomycetota bacterium]|nr:hypothetical protein [Planctomycetota bacterium]